MISMEPQKSSPWNGDSGASSIKRKINDHPITTFHHLDLQGETTGVHCASKKKQGKTLLQIVFRGESGVLEAGVSPGQQGTGRLKRMFCDLKYDLCFCDLYSSLLLYDTCTEHPSFNQGLKTSHIYICFEQLQP